MDNKLGKWAVLDIETTGIDPSYDQIIDVGFLQFEGTKLVRTYESLVNYEGELSYFIQKLTGINKKMAQRAPVWEAVEPEVMDVYGHHIIAHNAGFEEKFLSEHFEAIADESDRETYEDSLLYLALLFPRASNLKLETFIVEWGIADSELHRGLQDSIDLLKVLLVGTVIAKEDLAQKQTLTSLFRKYRLEGWWYAAWYNMDHLDYQEIADQIEFDLESAVEKAKSLILNSTQEITDENQIEPFNLEFSGKNIKDIFTDEEQIRKVFPKYKFRAAQADLSLKVGQSFKNNIHSLIQAPTGTGKTMGYLVPSALFSMAEERQVLVSTGTKTLQHQAMEKDVPQMMKLLSLDDSVMKVRRLVGSSNHLCELLFREAIQEDELLFETKEFEEKISDLFLELVFFHNSRSAHDEQILRGDIPYVMKMKLGTLSSREKEAAVDFRSCTGQSCPFKNECSYIRGLREAKDANIIVGNHALMFSWPRAFPRPAHIVVDEAHKIEDETTKAFSLEASQDGLEGFAKGLNNLQGLGSLFYLLAQNEINEGDSTATINTIREEAQGSYQMMSDHLIPLQEQVELYFKKKPKYTDIFWNELPMLKKEAQLDQTGRAIYNHFESLHFILSNLENYLMPYSSRWEAKSLDGENQIVALTRFETFIGQLEDLVVALDTALNNKEGFSHSMKFHDKHGYELSSAPINVGKLIHDQMLQTASSMVFTSATLGNASGNHGTRGVEWATGYSYLDPEKRFKSGLYLPATYDYKNNTKVFLCDDTPPFYDYSFIETVLKPVIKLIRDLGGRSLLLFSARKRFEAAREVLLKEFEGELPLFIQGMGNNVVEEFKKTDGVLLGMESFGEGIDIPGESLQFVFIDKIPDLRMDQVINDRREFYEANLGNEFTDYYLAHRTRALHQKLGRLIRTEKDVGGVIIVDARVRRWKGRTMEKLVHLMEPYELRRTTLNEACEQVLEFIEEKNSPVGDQNTEHVEETPLR